jgi:hypothetical protein
MALRTADDEGDQNLARMFAKLQLLLSRAEEEADSIRQLLASFDIRAPARRRPAAAAVRPDVRRFADPLWTQLARPGVGSLRIEPRVDRKVRVSIDGARTFMLTPRLADLLAVLADGEPDEEGFPAVRPYAALATAYSARTGRPAGVRAIVVGIGRLREQLMTVGAVSPLLVETRPGLGARFRLRLTSARRARDAPEASCD